MASEIVTPAKGISHVNTMSKAGRRGNSYAKNSDGMSYKDMLFSFMQEDGSSQPGHASKGNSTDNASYESEQHTASMKSVTPETNLLTLLALKSNVNFSSMATEPVACCENDTVSSGELSAFEIAEPSGTNKLRKNGDVYFKDVTVLRSAPSEANQENWLAGYAGKATLVTTMEANGVEWAAIRMSSGKIAYVRTDEISSTNPLLNPSGNRDTRASDISNMMGVKTAVKLYKTTDEQGDYTGAYGDETGLEVMERKTVAGEEWVKVKTCSNDVGWCKADKLCALEDNLHIIGKPSGNGYGLKLNVGSVPRSLIPSDLHIDEDGVIDCKIDAAYLKKSGNAHVYYDADGNAYGTRSVDTFDLAELDNSEISGTAGFTPDGWVDFKLKDGRIITINMVDLQPNQDNQSKESLPPFEEVDTRIIGDLDDDGKIDANDEVLFEDYVDGKVRTISNADVDNNGQIDENDLEKLKNMFLLNKYDINDDGKLDGMDGAILRNEKSHSGALTYMNKVKADFNDDGTIDNKDVMILDDILSKQKETNSMDVPSGIKGDANNDGKVDFADTYSIDKTIVGFGDTFSSGSLYRLSSNKEIAKQADINDDGTLTYIDLMAIKKATNNYSDIHVFSMKSYQSKFYKDMNCSELSYEYKTSSNTIFAAQVIDETESAYKVIMQARTSKDAQEYWIRKSSINTDLTPQIDKLVTEKMGIPIIERGYKKQMDVPIEPIVNPDNDSHRTSHTQDTNNEPRIKPTLTEENTDAARIFHVNLGYNQGEYFKEGGGLFITNLNVNKNINDETPIVFDLYNTKDAMGVIEYYDKSGKFIRADHIDSHDAVITDFESWLDKTKNVVDSISKYGFNGSPITHPINSTHLSIEAPKGTNRIVVTNNKNASLYAQAYSLVDEFFKAHKLYKNIKALVQDYGAFKSDTASNDLLDKVKDNLAKRIINQIENNVAYMITDGGLSEKEIQLDTVKSLVKKIGENGIKDLSLQGLNFQEAFEDTLEYVIKNSGQIALDKVKDVVGDVCKGLLRGNPAIFGLDALKLTGTWLDVLSKSITEKQLENVKPMIIQIEN